jgi:GNAT superfamily N-acetyltransferase
MSQMRLNSLLPSQLYISQLKYDYWSERLLSSGLLDYEPVPIKRIGNDIFLTDGHTRALVLWQHGVREVDAYFDTDDEDWIAYVEDLKWCRDAQIRSVADLSARIIPHAEYEVKWCGLCENAHRTRESNPLEGVHISLEEDQNARKSIGREVLENLPQWFGIPEATVEYVNTSASLPFVRVDLYDKPIGFCAIKVNFDLNADLYVLGILPEFHRKGIGRLMLDFVCDYCRKTDIPYMTVKTLGEKHPDPNYRKTREFYLSYGFKPFEDFPNLWDPANPCLYMLKPLK